MSHQVLVIGGGVGGCATALALQKHGLHAIVLERTAPDMVRVGEHLPPDARLLLIQLGLWQHFAAHEHLPCAGIRSCWGSDQAYEQDYIFNPYGMGWNLERRRFDAMLIDAARGAGAAIHTAARVISISPTKNGWQVEAIIGTQRQTFSSAFLVDATGRASAISRQLGSRRITRDRLVGIAGWMVAGEGADTADSMLQLEAVKEGWWYVTPLPGQRLVAVWMTDAPVTAGSKASLRSLWTAAMQRTHLTRQRTANYHLETVSLRPAHSYRMDPVAGKNWISTGDAAMAFDPLSSMGISKALGSAIQVADVICRHLGGDPAAMDHYVDQVNREFEKYLRTRTTYYRRETRWSGQKFWRSRHGAQSEDLQRIASIR